MSESSEKKLLKKMLAKLKEKAIKSQHKYLESVASAIEPIDDFGSAFEELVKVSEKLPKEFGSLLHKMKGTLNLLQIMLYSTFHESSLALGDLQLYLSSLEEYSAQLDDTLKGIFNAAKEEMEKLEAKRKEMEKRQPKYVK